MRKKAKEQENYVELPENDNSGFIIESDDEDVAENVAEYVKESEEQNVFFAEEPEEETASDKEEKKQIKFVAFLKSKKFIIPASIVVGLAVILTSAWVVLSHLWRNGDMVMPQVLANTGLFQGEDFKFIDGITVNGVDISGLGMDKARDKVEKQLANNNKTYDITVVAGESSFKLTEEEIVYVLDGDNALKEAKAFCVGVMKGENKKEKRNFSSSSALGKESIEKIKSKAKENIHKEPVDSTFSGVSDGKAQFTDDQAGYTVDEQNLISELSKFLSAGNTKGELKVSVVTVPAKITKADLSEKIVLLASHSTTSSNTADGNQNMKKAMQMCNGSIIKPGETWSFNACTGNSNIESSGWKKAVVYIGGRQDYGVGGGICQASTTIYNAALMANLGITERHYHNWAAGYAKPGFDATIDYPALDLRLTNNTDYPIYLECYMQGKKLVANFYGFHTDNYDKITLSYWETDRVEGEYYKISSSRILWKDGKKVSTETLPISRYSLKKKLWAGEEEEKPETDPDAGGNENSSKPESSKPESSKPESSKPESSTSQPSVSTPDNSSNDSDESSESGSSGSSENQDSTEDVTTQ